MCISLICTFVVSKFPIYNGAIIYRKRRCKDMDKEKVLKALNSIQDGKSAKSYHDEIETLITLVVNAKDEDIAAAWEDFHTDTE